MRDRHLKYLLVLPAVVVVFATAIWPLLQSLILSFRSWKLSRSNVPGPFVGFENYTWALLEEPGFWNATIVTGVYTVLTVGLTTLLALGIALLLAPGGRLEDLANLSRDVELFDEPERRRLLASVGRLLLNGGAG